MSRFSVGRLKTGRGRRGRLAASLPFAGAMVTVAAMIETGAGIIALVPLALVFAAMQTLHHLTERTQIDGEVEKPKLLPSARARPRRT